MVAAYGFTPAGGGSPPVNTVAPVVSGTTVQGSLLSTTDGTWTGSPTPTLTYQWQRDTGGNGVFSDISAATANAYTLTAADVGNDVRCVVTGTNASGSQPANSNAVGPISSSPAPPVNTAPPVVNGSTVQGSGLTVSDGTWTGSPAPTFTYQWQRDVAGNGVFSNISLATTNAYTLVAADVGNDVRCVVTATNGSGSASANSNAVGPIQPPPAPSNVAILGGFFF
jgi:fibronectin type 3 domain-containing protein